MNMYITAPSGYGDDYLVTEHELRFYDKIMEKEQITLGMFLEWLEEKEAEIYSFYIVNLPYHFQQLDLPMFDYLKTKLQEYLDIPIKEAVYQDLDVKIRLEDES